MSDDDFICAGVPVDDSSDDSPLFGPGLALAASEIACDVESGSAVGSESRSDGDFMVGGTSHRQRRTRKRARQQE